MKKKKKEDGKGREGKGQTDRQTNREGKKREGSRVESWQDREGVGGRMAVRIYGRFITLPALPRLL